MQRSADRFTTYYLPLVLALSVLTHLVTGRVLNAVAVVVVACSCAIVIAAPVVVFASVGGDERAGLRALRRACGASGSALAISSRCSSGCS